MLNLNHKKLDVWKHGIQLVKLLYKLTEAYPKEEVFGLTNQIRRSAVSVPNNIAEGSARCSVKERIRFYEISRSSLVEIDNLLEISMELKIIDSNDLTEINENINIAFAKLSKLTEKPK